MIIHLNEHRFSRLFLTESKNSDRAHKQTRVIIAQQLGKAVDDPQVVEAEQYFEKRMFGEGLRTDWFITLEPYAYNWGLTSSVFGLDGVYEVLKYLFTKAQTAENRTAFMQQIKSFQTFTEVRNFVGECQKADRAYARENGTNVVDLNKNYQVLGPLSYEEAKQYGDYSGYGAGQSGRICYTQSLGTWLSSSYSNDNANNCFILLRNDWKEVTTEHDGSERNNGLPEPLNQYNGYDDYGLSMIVLFITPEGELHECNTRWNHEARYAPGHRVDLALTQTDIERLMGAPFESIFNSNSFYDKADAIGDRLANGEDLSAVFDYVEQLNESFSLVELNKRYNIFSINEKRLLFPHDWFKGIGALNTLGDYILSYNGDYVFLIDFKDLYTFYDYVDILEKRLKEGYNINALFNYVKPINNRYSFVYIMPSKTGNIRMDFQNCNLYNFETKEFISASYEWPRDGDVINEGENITLIKFYFDSSPKVNFVSNDSKLLLDAPIEEWYRSYDIFRTQGKTFLHILSEEDKQNIATVKDDGSFGFVFKQWFDNIEANLGLGVKLDGYYENIYVNIQNNGLNFYGDYYHGDVYLTDLEFIDKINKYAKNGQIVFGRVQLLTVHSEKTNFVKVLFESFDKRSYNVYDKVNNKLLFPTFVDDVKIITKDGLFMVKVNEKYNITYLGGPMLYEAAFKEWPDDIVASDNCQRQLFTVSWENVDEDNNYSVSYNIMDLNGKLLLKENCQNMTQFIDGICVIEKMDGECNFINENLDPLFENWFAYVDLYDFEDDDVAFVRCTPKNDDPSVTNHAPSPTFYSKINHKLITKDEIEKLFYNYLKDGDGYNMVLDVVNEWGDFDKYDILKDFSRNELMQGQAYYSVSDEIDNWLERWLNYFIEKYYYDFLEDEEEEEEV